MKTGLTTGVNLTITIERRKETDPNFLLRANYEEEDGNGFFLISAPFYHDFQFPVEFGEILDCMYLDAKATFSFSGEVVERVKKDNLNFLKLRQTKEVVRAQRRDDFRLPIVLHIKIDQVVEENGTRSLSRQSCVTIDLSGGGVALRSNAKFVKGEVVAIHLPIAEGGAFSTVPGEVSWIKKNDNINIPWKYAYGLVFIHKDKVSKEKLVKFVFKKQLDMRRNGI